MTPGSPGGQEAWFHLWHRPAGQGSEGSPSGGACTQLLFWPEGPHGAAHAVPWPDAPSLLFGMLHFCLPRWEMEPSIPLPQWPSPKLGCPCTCPGCLKVQGSQELSKNSMVAPLLVGQTPGLTSRHVRWLGAQGEIRTLWAWSGAREPGASLCGRLLLPLSILATPPLGTTLSPGQQEDSTQAGPLPRAAKPT